MTNLSVVIIYNDFLNDNLINIHEISILKFLIKYY